MVKYRYDAWGNHAVQDANGADIADANHIGVLNPFRYRGYYYDTETELYYLQTRYYDTETGRFITIDGISYINLATINGLNLYAYCGNNPVMRTDGTGTEWWKVWEWDWAAIGRAIAGAVISFKSFTEAPFVNPIAKNEPDLDSLIPSVGGYCRYIWWSQYATSWI